MKEVYRIKRGKLTIKNTVIAFDFGLIFEQDGVLIFDFYVSDSFDLNSFMKSNDDYNLEFSMTALTDENNLIEATNLFFKNVSPYKSYIKAQSFGYIKHTEISDHLDNEETDKESQTLFYLELEGLKMEYSNLTEFIKARGGNRIKDFNDLKRDHTDALLVYNSGTNIGCNNFKFTFFQSENNDNIFVELPNFKTNGPNVLHYDLYLEFKKDFVSLLSLLNGAEVKVRKEYIGGFYQIGQVGSQTVISYSFNTLKNKNHNSYIPLNNGFYKGNNILNSVLISCFDKYILENKKLDLNSIVFYLNGAEQSKSIGEKFFILIIAFERLAKKYVNTLNDTELQIILEDEFQPIKKDLLEILKRYKSKNNDSAISRLMSKVGSLNKITKRSTEYKFLKILEYSKIELTSEINKIINEVRHETVHEGEIGNGNEGLKNYIILNELLRDIILNIIGYNNARVSRYRINKKH